MHGEIVISWEAIGALGEILGALAVFLTLAYLAVQIRQNTKAVRASALDSSVTSIMSVRKTMFESAELSTIFNSGLANPDSLTDDERVRFRMMMQNVMWGFWNVYAQAEYANLSASVWRAQIPIITRILPTEGGRWFWNGFRHEFEDSFRREIDKAIAEKQEESA